MRPRLRLRLLLPLTLLALPQSTWAQAAGAGADTTAHLLLARGDSAHQALQPLDALLVFTRLADLDPGNPQLLWRASREAVNLGMLAQDRGERKAWYEKGVKFARAGRDADPTNATANEWLAIALGRQALDEGPKTRVELAVEIRSVALTALALDSTNAGAQHVLGEWNAEVRRLSGVERWMARKLLGGDVLKEASWAGATAHLERAVALDPGGLVHHLDLARTYLDTDRTQDARQQLYQVLDLPTVEPADPVHKQAAARLLEASARITG